MCGAMYRMGSQAVAFCALQNAVHLGSRSGKVALESYCHGERRADLGEAMVMFFVAALYVRLNGETCNSA